MDTNHVIIRCLHKKSESSESLANKGLQRILSVLQGGMNKLANNLPNNLDELKRLVLAQTDLLKEQAEHFHTELLQKDAETTSEQQLDSTSGIR